MTTHPDPDKDFRVYSFGDEEDAAVERAAGAAVLKYLKRTRSPSPGENVEETVDFLGAFGGMKKLKYPISSFELRPAASERTSAREEILLSSGSKNNQGCHVEDPGNTFHNCLALDCIETGCSTQSSHTHGSSQHEANLSELASNINQTDISSDDSEGRLSHSSSYHTSSDRENEGSFDPRNFADRRDAKDMDIDATVMVTPDYVVYQSEFYVESQLTFAVDSIRLECSNANRGERSLRLNWAITDLLFICCGWHGSIETALIEVQLKETDICSTTQENIDNLPGFRHLAFIVCGSEWLGKEEKIFSLAPKYKDLWKAELDVTSNAFFCNLEGSIPFYHRHQLNLFEETLGDVVYPRGDPDAVSISRRDIELLRPETFINDTIIDFYIKYLLNTISKDERSRFHFFNSFFFRKLADLDKDPASVIGGRAAFLRVRKWTRKVDIFEKDYIFIPVNFNLHWSLLVICHPGEILNFRDEDVYKALKVPCILHLDSIKGSHNGLKGLIQSYLWEEWKERHSECSEETSSNFLNLRFVPLELPQQENYFDCGLFLLHYVELFLKEPPVNFSPFRINTFCDFLSVDWFIPAEASFKRFHIRNLLYELLGSTTQSVPSHACNGEHSLLSPDVNTKDESEPHKKMIHVPSLGDACLNVVGDKIELELFKRSSIDGPMLANVEVNQPFREPKALEDVCDHMKDDITFESGRSVGLSKCLMPTIMEDEDDFDQSPSWQASLTLNRAADGTSHLSGGSDDVEVLRSPEGLDLIDEQEDDLSLSNNSTSPSVKECEQSLSRIDRNDDRDLPVQSSGFLHSSFYGKFAFILPSDSVYHVSGSAKVMEGDRLDGDDLVTDFSCSMCLVCEEGKVKPPNAIITEVLETGIVSDSQDDDLGATYAVSHQDADGIAASSFPIECEVVPDSPERKLMHSSNDKDEVPDEDATIHVSTETFINADECSMLSKDIKILDDVSDSDSPCETCPDVSISEKQQPRKRQKHLQPRIERKQTRSSTRPQSL